MIPDPPGRIIRTPNVRIAEALIMPGSMFSDGKSRAYVHDSMTDGQVAKLEQAIQDGEKMQSTVDAILAITTRARDRFGVDLSARTEGDKNHA